MEAAFRRLHFDARRTSFGRPYVAGVGALGVSHAGSQTAYLIATRKYVGIDLELWDRPDLQSLERRLKDIVKGQDGAELGFLTRWVLKEAGLKALGLPLIPTLRRVRVLAETSSDIDGMRSFDMAVGPIAMRGLTLDFGLGLIGLAYKSNYSLPAISFAFPGVVPEY